MAGNGVLVSKSFQLSVMQIGAGRTTWTIAPNNAICEKNGRLMWFRVLWDDGSSQEFMLAPKASRAYNVLKFVEKSAVVFAVGWAAAANNSPSRGMREAQTASKYLNDDRVDTVLDKFHDFTGVREWAYYDANSPSRGPVLEGPIHVR